MGKARFQDTLERVRALSEEKQQPLVDIVKHRLVEQRREELAILSLMPERIIEKGKSNVERSKGSIAS